MKAQELRIGNLVKYNNREFHLYGVNKDYPFLDTEEFGVGVVVGVVEWNDLEPVPLTEEWLVKFGFLKRPMSFDIEINEHTILQLSLCNDKGKGEYYAMINQEGELISLPIRIFYVHQLQNLYLTLTSKELEKK